MSSGNAFIGKPAPNFTATAVMPDGQFKDIKLSDYKGKLGCFFNYTGLTGHRQQGRISKNASCFGFEVIMTTWQKAEIHNLGCGSQ